MSDPLHGYVICKCGSSVAVHMVPERFVYRDGSDRVLDRVQLQLMAPHECEATKHSPASTTRDDA